MHWQTRQAGEAAAARRLPANALGLIGMGCVRACVRVRLQACVHVRVFEWVCMGVCVGVHGNAVCVCVCVHAKIGVCLRVFERDRCKDRRARQLLREHSELSWC